jgi:hypothetical protein
MSLGISAAMAGSAPAGGGAELEIQKGLRAGLSQLNVAEGLRAKWKAVGERWAVLGQDATKLWVRITNALFGLSPKTIDTIVSHVGSLFPDEVVKKFGTIVKNLEANIFDSPTVKMLNAACQEAAAEVRDLLSPGASPQDQVATGDAAGQVVAEEVKPIYNQRYHEIVSPKLGKLRENYANIGKNPQKGLGTRNLQLLGNPDPTRVSKHRELANLMVDLSRIVRYGDSSDMQSSRVSDLSQAHNPDILRYDPTKDEFISPCMPEIAQFCTQLKREFDESFEEITRPYKDSLPDRIAAMETQAKLRISNGTPAYQARMPLFSLRVEISNMNVLLGYTGNTHAISAEAAAAADLRIADMG